MDTAEADLRLGHPAKATQKPTPTSSTGRRSSPKRRRFAASHNDSGIEKKKQTDSGGSDMSTAVNDPLPDHLWGGPRRRVRNQKPLTKDGVNSDSSSNGNTCDLDKELSESKASVTEALAHTNRSMQSPITTKNLRVLAGSSRRRTISASSTGTTVEETSAAEYEANLYLQLRESMTMAVVSFKALKEAQDIAAVSGEHSAQCLRITKLLNEGLGAFTPFYSGLHEECTVVLNSMLERKSVEDFTVFNSDNDLTKDSEGSIE